MKEKTRVILIEDTQYQLRRFAPDVGSFILGRVLSGGAKAMLETMKSLADVRPPESTVPIAPPVPVDADTAADAQTRRMATGAFSVLSFEDRSQIQRRCLEMCSRLEGPERTPMPLTNASGSLVDDLALILQLEVEVLVFNFSDFFVKGGLNVLHNTPTPRI